MATTSAVAAQVRDDDQDAEHGKLPSALPERFVKLPIHLLGKILDYKQRKNEKGNVAIHGHASVSGILLLAIKMDKPNQVLNERNVKKRYGVSRRRFQEGLTVLTERDVLEREQT